MQRLKQIVPICFVISLFSNSAFATDPDISVNDTGTGMCVYDVLDTYSGTAGFKANWEANNIKLRWYNGNTQLDVQSNANDCDYNSGLNVPSNTLTRTGYTFSGWTKRPEYNFATLYPTENGLQTWGRGLNPDNGNHFCATYYQDGGGAESCNLVDYKDLAVDEWKVQFSWGMLYGTAKCSETNGGTRGTPGNPSNTFGTYCWCKATGYKPNNSNTIYAPTQPQWIFRTDLGNANCMRCSPNCASEVRYHYVMIRAILGAN